MFDSKDEKFYIINRTNEIEHILNNSPVKYKDKIVGTVTFSQNRSNTSLYYGNIFLTENIGDHKTIKVVDKDLNYKFITDNIVCLTDITLHIEKVM
jgi:hypothetical protein